MEKGRSCNFLYFLCIKMSEKTYYQENRDVVLNRAKDYCENDKERLREQAREKYRNLSEEEKIKRENMEEADIRKTKTISEKLLWD